MDNPSVPRFRDNYIYKTKAYKIKPKLARWYVGHAEQYNKAYPDQRLGSHAPREVEHYLRVKGRSPLLEGWQFRQLVESLRILFVEMARAPWADAFPGREWSTAAESLPAQ